MFDTLGPYQEAWKSIISPARQEYSISDLGPKALIINNNRIQRTDFRLLNNRGHLIECSFFEQHNITTPVPCVLYLHGNGCSRIEATHYLETVLSLPVSLFCFDFSGCGKSEGQYTSVGWHEQDDLDCMIQYLFNTGKVSRIAVWGRSMGSITALLHAKKNPKVSCYVFDSPFSNFKQAVKELIKQKAPIPDFLVTGALKMLRNTVLKKANFDIEDLQPGEVVGQMKVPALFGAAKDDSLIPSKHAQDLYDAYGGVKDIMLFTGDHNSRRPPEWKQAVQDFLRIHLVAEKLVANPSVINPVKYYFSSEYRHEESGPRQLKRSSMSLHEDMKFSWLEHSDSVKQVESTPTFPMLNNTRDFSNETISTRSTADSSQAKSMHYRRAATCSIQVTQSFETSKLAAKECLSPTADLLSIARNNSSSNKTDSSEHSQAHSEDVLESSGLKDISSMGLNRSSGMNALKVKPFITEDKVFGKKEVKGIAVSHSVSDKQEWSKKDVVASHLGKTNMGHQQNKKSLLLQVKLDLKAPVINSVTQTARSSMTDFLSKNLYLSAENKIRMSLDGPGVKLVGGYRTNG